MTDIVLNTNAFRVLLDDAIVDKMTKKRDHIFVARCTWTKELKGVYTHLITLVYNSVKRLGKTFHVKKVEKNILPKNLKKEILKNGGDYCDMRIANLACDRHGRSKQRVTLVSNDNCFLNPELLFGRCGVTVEDRQTFTSSY